VLSVEVLAGLPPIRQKLSFLNERFLVKLEELHRIWNNSNCLPEWQIVLESSMLSRTLFFTEFDLHLVDLIFVPNVHNGVQMGFFIIALRLLLELQGASGARGASGTNRHLYRRDRGFGRT
jgi:hypothetical protein